MNKTIISKDDNKSQEVEKYLSQRLTIARVELNFEKLPIWSPKPKRGTVFQPSKIIELEPEKLPDGNIIKRRVEIVPSAKYGYPTVQTQEYWYGIQYLWDNSLAQETGRIDFSRRQLIENILGKKYGKDQRRALDLSINQLAATLFEFYYVFYDKEQDLVHRELRKFSLVIDSHLTKRKKQGEVIHDQCSVTLHPLVVSNLRSGYFKPILLSVVSQLKSDVARLLYRKLDSQFSYYSKYEISTERFFREQGIVGNDYKYPSARKRLLEKAIRELINKPTSSGAVIKFHDFQKTSDGKDWKLIIVSERKKLNAKKKEPKSTPKPTTKKPVGADSEALKALAYFHKVFLGKDEQQFSQNIILKASKIIKEHGLEKTKFLIDFAFQEAPKTNYQPKTFSGIVQYLPDALQAWDNQIAIRKRKEEDARKVAQARIEQEKADHEKRYEEDYYTHIDELVCDLGEKYPQKFNEFRSWQTAQRRQKEQFKGQLRDIALQVFDSEGQIMLRLTEFFTDDPDIHIPDFWEWDRTHNPYAFGREKE